MATATVPALSYSGQDADDGGSEFFPLDNLWGRIDDAVDERFRANLTAYSQAVATLNRRFDDVLRLETERGAGRPDRPGRAAPRLTPVVDDPETLMQLVAACAWRGWSGRAICDVLRLHPSKLSRMRKTRRYLAIADRVRQEREAIRAALIATAEDPQAEAVTRLRAAENLKRFNRVVLPEPHETRDGAYMAAEYLKTL